MSEELASYIDHTLLKPEATAADIEKLCQEARASRFFAVCLNPVFVKRAAELLKESNVKICTVIGFPLGANTTEVKVYEATEAINDGADELDMVISVGALKSGDDRYVEQEIAAVVSAAKGIPLKVIIEAGLLTENEKIRACQAAKRAGAAYVKTSTGFGPGGATAADIRLMREAVGSDLGIKASGGIRDRQTVEEMIAAGATRIGTSSGLAITS